MVCIEKCYFLRYTNNSVDIFYNLNFNPPASHFKVQPSARKKFWPSNQAGEKEGGWGEEFRHARAVARHFRRLGIKTSKQNNFQFLLRKIWRAGVKKLKENCFALLAEFRRAETQSGVNQAFFVQKRFELRSAIATKILGKRVALESISFQ